MKKCISLALFVFLGFISFAQPVSNKEARIVAEVGLQNFNSKGSSIGMLYEQHRMNPLFYIFQIEPVGYIVVSSDKKLPPIIAFSPNQNITIPLHKSDPLIKLLDADLSLRMENIDLVSGRIIDTREETWNKMLNSENKNMTETEYWPEQGTTNSGGWIESNWKQNGYYDNFCPVDPVTVIRSLVGCPATAMGMIIEFFETVNATTFSDEDEYFHSYAGRNYHIDDDYLEHDFLCFDTINLYMDTIAGKFSNVLPLSSNDKAALSFACGVAAKHVYSSEGSGTFGVNQAFQAYQKFGFNDAELLENGDPDIITTMASNMKEARPVHLAVVDQTWTTGHNVVVDGYNSEGFFHVNFGWGGSSNGWYLLPDELPYNLTVIEGAVVNIDYPPYGTNVEKNNSVISNNMRVFPNPATTSVDIYFEYTPTSGFEFKLYNQSGSLIYTKVVHSSDLTNNYIIPFSSISNLIPGVYFVKACNTDFNQTQKVVILP